MNIGLPSAGPELDPTRPESREDTMARMFSTDPLKASTSSLKARSGRSSLSSISTSSSFSECVLINFYTNIKNHISKTLEANGVRFFYPTFYK